MNVRTFALKCTLCGNPTSTHIASSGHKYCEQCACKRLGMSNAHIIVSLEFLQVIRGAMSMPPRLRMWTAREIYDRDIFHKLLYGNEIADIVFRRTFHIDDLSTSLLWHDIPTQLAMSELLEKVLVRLYVSEPVPIFDTPDIMLDI